MKGLILEGGARKCIYTAGVLDCFAKNGLKFDYINGVSAGAQAGLDFVSGQIGRTRGLMLNENVVLGTSMSLHSIMNSTIDKMSYSDPYGENPFDFSAFFSSETQVEVTVTACESGKAEYLSEKEDEHRLLDMLRASCSLPGIFELAQVDGKEYVDGCIADSIPCDRAFEVGCDSVVVILSKSAEEKALDYSRFRVVYERMFGEKYPKLLDAMMKRYENYNLLMEHINQLEEEGRIKVIKPDRFYVHAFDMRKDRLEQAYHSGFMDGELFIHSNM